MIWLILVPITFGMTVSARFNPKKTSFRLFFGLLMFVGIIGVSTWNSFLLKKTLHTYHSAQVSSVDQLFRQQFKLSSSPASYSAIFEQEKVLLFNFLRLHLTLTLHQRFISFQI